MKKVIKDIVTDNQGDFDVVSVCGIIAFFALITFSGYSVYKTQTFDPIGFATGAGALLVGIGGGYRFKSGLPNMDRPDSPSGTSLD